MITLGSCSGVMWGKISEWGNKMGSFDKLASGAGAPKKCDTVSESEIRNHLAEIKRDRLLIGKLSEYCNNHERKILMVSGLRRTGKTILMMRQALNLIDAGQKVEYLQINKTDTQSSLFSGIEFAVAKGARYLFIDEVTYVDGFARWADWIYDHTVLKGVFCIMSGTDSFGLVIAAGDPLYDRVKFVKTTHMPYSDYRDIVGGGLSEYLCTGGIFHQFNVREYVETSIVSNIVDSINRYSDYGYQVLDELLDDELRSAIIKTIANVTIRFALRLLINSYKYPDMRSAVELIRKREPLFSIENIEAIQDEIGKRLGMKENLNRFTKSQIDGFVSYLEYVLVKIDVITEYDYVRIYPDTAKKYVNEEYTITQSGLRYEQTRVYLDVLNRLYAGQSPLSELITQDMEGRLLEAAVMVHIIRKLAGESDNYACKKYDVFKVSYGDREIDIVVVDLVMGVMSLFEVKRSSVININQRANLMNNDLVNAVKVEALNRNILKIDQISAVGRYILYTGKPDEIDGIKYVNVEDYLLNRI